MNTENYRELSKIVQVPIERISANSLALRGKNDPELAGLIRSIEENGLIQPIILRQLSADSFEIIAGERRARACMALNYTKIPSMIMEADEQNAAVTALVENIQRKNLDAFEQAKGMRILIKRYKFTQESLGKILGLTQSAVANKLRLLRLESDAINIVRENNLTERHARALLALPNDKQAGIAQYIVDKSLNVEQSENHILKLLRKDGTKQRGTVIFAADMRIFMNTLKNAVDFMKSAGVNINTDEYEEGDYINVVVKIPKTAAYNEKSSA